MAVTDWKSIKLMKINLVHSLVCFYYIFKFNKKFICSSFAAKNYKTGVQIFGIASVCVTKISASIIKIKKFE